MGAERSVDMPGCKEFLQGFGAVGPERISERTGERSGVFVATKISREDQIVQCTIGADDTRSRAARLADDSTAGGCAHVFFLSAVGSQSCPFQDSVQ